MERCQVHVADQYSDREAGIGAGWRAALLMEAPMAIPFPGVAYWRSLGTARPRDASRPWSAGAGAGVLATGLAQTAWILGALAVRRSGLTVTTRIDRWQRPEARLLLAEAFVSATGKPVPVTLDQYATDAAAAGKEFVRRELAAETEADQFGDHPGSAARRVAARLRVDVDEIDEQMLENQHA